MVNSRFISAEPVNILRCNSSGVKRLMGVPATDKSAAGNFLLGWKIKP